MIKLEVKSEIAEAKLSLENLGIEIAGIGRKILRALATLGKKRVRKRMGEYLHLYRNMNSLDFSNTRGLRDAVYGFARSPDHAVVASGEGYKAEPLERGTVINPKKRKYLSFRGDDEKWHRVKQVTIAARHWFTRSIEGLEDEPEYQATIDKVLGKAIKKAGL